MNADMSGYNAPDPRHDILDEKIPMKQLKVFFCFQRKILKAIDS